MHIAAVKKEAEDSQSEGRNFRRKAVDFTLSRAMVSNPHPSHGTGEANLSPELPSPHHSFHPSSLLFSYYVVPLTCPSTTTEASVRHATPRHGALPLTKYL